jgi:hypothetical protein
MPRFMMMYKGDATDPADMTEEERQAVMAAWGEWMEKVGSALVDVGAPLQAGASIIDDGSVGTPTPLSGYSIVEADDLGVAQRLAEGHPYLIEGKGDYAIDLYELLPVPM